MNAQEFYDACEKLDWHYAMSDDHRVWTRGIEANDKLMDQAPLGSENRAIYDAWHKHIFSGEPWGTPKAPKPERPANDQPS